MIEDPEILRRIEVPVGTSLGDLHAVIQIAMGWENSHLYAFHVGRSLSWSVPDPDWSDDATEVDPDATYPRPPRYHMRVPTRRLRRPLALSTSPAPTKPSPSE